MANAHARELAGKAALVCGHSYGGGTAPEQHLSTPLDSLRKPLETSTGLGRDQPHGVGGVNQCLEFSGGLEASGYRVKLDPRVDRNDFNAPRSRAGKPRVRRRHDRMASHRRQILEQGGPHRESLARKRPRHTAPRESTAGHELVDEDAHRLLTEYVVKLEHMLP